MAKIVGCTLPLFAKKIGLDPAVMASPLITTIVDFMDYVQRATDSVGISVHAGSPFPMAVLRLPENEIVWGNPAFFTVTGLSDHNRYQTFESVIPGFTTDFLREGRNEYPGDQLINGRRYRIYGNYVRSEDNETTVLLATVYLADMLHCLLALQKELGIAVSAAHFNHHLREIGRAHV